MKVLYGKELSFELRKLCDNIKQRLWIAVPYIGNPDLVSKVLGRKWHDSPSVSVRLLTDISSLASLDTETVQLFHDRDEVKSLPGLHAKIYIIDSSCLLTSANLTNTAFSKRHEIGILLQGTAAENIIKVFQKWWSRATDLSSEELGKIFKKKRNSNEDIRSRFIEQFALPESAGSFRTSLEKRFLHYPRFQSDYKNFGRLYSSIQRLYPNKPINFEIDGLFDYLYHHAPGYPSQKYASGNPRFISKEGQRELIKKWAKKYKEWVRRNNDHVTGWRLERSRKIKRLLSPKKVKKLTKNEIEELLLCTNAMYADQRNLSMIFSKNKLSQIKDSLNELVNGVDEPPARLSYCSRIKNLGPHTMYELLGFFNPDKYPLINKNSKSGLRFFGYPIKIHG